MASYPCICTGRVDVMEFWAGNQYFEKRRFRNSYSSSSALVSEGGSTGRSVMRAEVWQWYLLLLQHCPKSPCELFTLRIMRSPFGRRQLCCPVVTRVHIFDVVRRKIAVIFDIRRGKLTCLIPFFYILELNFYKLGSNYYVYIFFYKES